MAWITVVKLLDNVWNRQVQPHIAVRNIKVALQREDETRSTILRFCRRELTMEQTIQTLDLALIVCNFDITPEQKAHALMIARNLLKVRFCSTQVDKKVYELRQQMGLHDVVHEVVQSVYTREQNAFEGTVVLMINYGLNQRR